MQAAADRSGIRVLFIKGPALHRQGLRAERVSADIDVLVEPSRFDELCGAVIRAGWVERPSNFISTRTTLHSKTYIRDGWPCDLDVHSFYPGFLAEPEVVFEELWARRESMAFAGQSCVVPDRVAGVLILALHSLRGATTQERHGRELDELRDAPLTDREHEELATLAQRTGSAETLRDVLREIGVEAGDSEAEPSVELVRWRQRVAAGSHGSYFWLATVRDAPWHERPMILWRALWPTRHDLLVARPETVDTFVGRTRARVARFGRGIRSLPRGLRAIFTRDGR